MSLHDLLHVYALDYIRIGETLERIITDPEATKYPTLPIPQPPRERLLGQFTALRGHCEQIGLSTSVHFIDELLALLQSPQDVLFATVTRETAQISRLIDHELDGVVFLFIPPLRARWYVRAPDLANTVRQKFGAASNDMREAARSLGLGLDTAAVFHLMRVLEHGLCALAAALSVPYELENWKNVIDQIEAKIKELSNAPKSTQKSEDLQFYSEAAKEFRYFKDAWRNHVSHSRAQYDADATIKIMQHVRDFTTHIATRLPSPPVPGLSA